MKTLSIEAYTKALRKLSDYQLGIAARTTLNDLAFDCRRNYVAAARRSFTLRHPFTIKSMRVDRARGTDVARMFSVAGSIASYMERQETGFMEAKQGKHGIPLPASSRGRRKKRRGRVASYKGLSLTKVPATIRGYPQKRKTPAMVDWLSRHGGGVAFLHLRNGNSGLYRVKSGGTGRLVTKLWDLSKGAVSMSPNTLLDRAAKEAGQKAERFWRRAIRYQLKRL